MSDEASLNFTLIQTALDEYLGVNATTALGGDNFLFRNVTTGQFAYSADIYTLFRENYDELVAAGAITALWG